MYKYVPCAKSNSLTKEFLNWLCDIDKIPSKNVMLFNVLICL